MSKIPNDGIPTQEGVHSNKLTILCPKGVKINTTVVLESLRGLQPSSSHRSVGSHVTRWLSAYVNIPYYYVSHSLPNPPIFNVSEQSPWAL